MGNKLRQPKRTTVILHLTQQAKLKQAAKSSTSRTQHGTDEHENFEPQDQNNERDFHIRATQKYIWF